MCAAADLPGPVGVRLLGRDLVIARLGGPDDHRVVAMSDRCPHRSTRLSVGQVDGDCVRCAYHGWAFASDGRCVDIPSMPDGPIPGRAAVESFDAVVEHGLVWVRLDPSVATAVPACPALVDPEMKVLAGAPYTWPVAAPRRVENFVDLAHFAFVHDGSLGRRDEPVPPIPDVRRVDGELRFEYDPPAYPDGAEATALLAASAYRMPMPCSVDIAFSYPDGRRRRLWMAASPVDDAACRTFWFVARTDDLAGDDRDHLAFQARVLAEDEPVVCNQVPSEMLLDPGAELSCPHRQGVDRVPPVAARARHGRAGRTGGVRDGHRRRPPGARRPQRRSTRATHRRLTAPRPATWRSPGVCLRTRRGRGYLVPGGDVSISPADGPSPQRWAS